MPSLQEEASKVALAILRSKDPCYVESQTTGFQHLLQAAFLSPDFEEKLDYYFSYMPYTAAISFPNANDLILAFVPQNF